MVLAKGQGLLSKTPLNIKKVAGFPMKPPIESPNARLNPTTIHKILMMPMQTKLWSMVEITFLVLTIPP
jgi:hypothetical protein